MIQLQDLGVFVIILYQCDFFFGSISFYEYYNIKAVLCSDFQTEQLERLHMILRVLYPQVKTFSMLLYLGKSALFMT